MEDERSPGPVREPPAGGRRVTRGDLELVIRRAAELYATETDAGDHLTEDDVLQIAGELGLPPRLARQALYELPRHRGEPSLADRLFGAAEVVTGRSVPGSAPAVFDRLEDYLTTREYLQVIRRRDQAAVFAPAEDMISSLARTFTRPDKRYHLARSRNVRIAVRPLDQGRSHVRLDLDLGDRRRNAILTGFIGGGLVSAPLGAAVAIPVGIAVASMTGDAAAVAAAITTGMGTFGLGMTGAIKLAGMHFHRRVERARLELDGLLDRLQRNERLAPPPSPWLRRLKRSASGGAQG